MQFYINFKIRNVPIQIIKYFSLSSRDLRQATSLQTGVPSEIPCSYNNGVCKTRYLLNTSCVNLGVYLIATLCTWKVVITCLTFRKGEFGPFEFKKMMFEVIYNTVMYILSVGCERISILSLQYLRGFENILVGYKSHFRIFKSSYRVKLC